MIISPTAISPLNLRQVDGQAPFSFGNALQFDGVNDYVSFTPISNGDVDHSYSMWIKHNQAVTGFNIAYIRSAISSAEYIGTHTASSIRYRVGAIADFTVPTFVVGNWFHLVITYKSGVGTRLYFNGTESSTGLVSGSQNFKFDELGRYATNIYGAKTMDEIAAFSQTLTPAQVSNLYNGGNGNFANIDVTPLVWFRMNESGTDTTAVNSGSGGATYDGTLNNFPASGMWVAH